MYQLPVLALTISVSSGLNNAKEAERRTPPLNTASLLCITISYASIGRSFFCLLDIHLSRIKRIFSNPLASGSGPGALPTLEDNDVPFSLIWE